MDNVALAKRLPDLLEFRQEAPMQFVGNDDRVVVTRFLVIQDLTAVVDAYSTSATSC